jgi:Amt family ammonium transporter
MLFEESFFHLNIRKLMLFQSMLKLGMAVPALTLIPFSAHAATDTGDTALVLAASALVMLMTIPSLALFYAGLIRAKNAVSVMMQIFALVCVLSLTWIIVAYSLAFSGDGAWIGDLGRLMMANIAANPAGGTIPESVFVIFQMTFAIITPAVVVGTYVERMNFAAVLIFSVLWLLIVYAPVAHWVWGGGIMAAWGVMDFAGGLVVHTTAGTAGLVIALVLGRRVYFPDAILPPHSPILTTVGACMLWVGWLGFNGGSTLQAGQGAGLALLVTHIAACIGALSWLIIERIRFGRPSLIGVATGAVGGLAAVTPASGFIGVPGGVILGLAGGLICYCFVILIRLILKIDDSLDILAVHGIGGIIGTLLVAFLATGTFSGLGLPEGATATSQFIVQLNSVAVTIVWSAVLTYALLKLTALIVPLRVTRDVEIEGLDLAQHGEVSFRGSR